jgi:hypothetical protein
MTLLLIKRIITRIILLLVITIILSSCENEGEEDEIKISYYNGTESHRAGEDCMNCHIYGGSGEYWFQISGTVYDSTLINTFPNATVKLYSEPNGTGELKYTVEVDAFGNFYSTEQIDFGNGLYASVQGNVSTTHMLSAVTTGRCNSCHGNSMEVIRTK